MIRAAVVICMNGSSVLLMQTEGPGQTSIALGKEALSYLAGPEDGIKTDGSAFSL